MFKPHSLLPTLLLIVLTACAPVVRTAPLLPTGTPPPAPTATMRVVTDTPQPTATLTLTATADHSPTPLPDVRVTPLTIMLHRPSATFDSVAFLRDFITILQKENLRVVTYRDLSEDPALSAVQSGSLAVITIDDIYLRYPMADGIKEMIAMLKEAGMPAVLGVITDGDYAYPETVSALKELNSMGWETASHTDTHRNLLEVQAVAPKSIYPEIKTSLDKIEKAVGQRPITVVLPFGQMVNGSEQIIRTGVTWVVGINGGVTYHMDEPFHYVGRESPGGTAQQTMDAMRQRFKEPPAGT